MKRYEIRDMERRLNTTIFDIGTVENIAEMKRYEIRLTRNRDEISWAVRSGIGICREGSRKYLTNHTANRFKCKYIS